MNDKTRAEFEYWASDDGYNPAAVERSGHSYKLAQIQTYWQAWLAAKEKYEPRWISVEERLPQYEGHPYSKGVIIWCPDILCSFMGCYEFQEKEWSFFGGENSLVRAPVSHWAEPLTAPSTQGGGE